MARQLTTAVEIAGAPPTPLHRHLAEAFGGALVRSEQQPRFEMFTVQRDRPAEFRLAVSHALLEARGYKGVLDIVERCRVVARMREHVGRAIALELEEPSGLTLVHVLGTEP